jgi:hypothetical protein
MASREPPIALKPDLILSPRPSIAFFMSVPEPEPVPTVELSLPISFPAPSLLIFSVSTETEPSGFIVVVLRVSVVVPSGFVVVVISVEVLVCGFVFSSNEYFGVSAATFSDSAEPS